MITILLLTLSAHASTVSDPRNEELATHLSPVQVETEKRDLSRFPKLSRFLSTLRINEGLVPSDPRNAHIVPTRMVFQPTKKMWKDFFVIAAEEKLTVMKAFCMIARELKKRGVVNMGPGADFTNAVEEQKVDLGLALPATHLGTAIWAPDPKNTDPEFLLHMKVFYTETYIHKFPDHILPANLKIGQGPIASYWLGGHEYRQPTVDTDLYYGPTRGCGFRNVKGIGGQKRGFLGVLQDILFFLPDAVDSMYVDEKSGSMITEALVNTTVENFETDPKYGITIRQ